MVRFLILVVATTSMVLVMLMFRRLWKKITLAVKLILAVFVLSAISRLWQDTKTLEELMPLLIAMVGFGVVWVFFWAWGNWNLRGRQRRAARAARGLADTTSEPRKA